MRSYITTALAIVMCMVLASSTHAEYGLSVKVGTPGIGLDVTKDITDTLNLRLGINWFSYEMTETDEDDDEDEGDNNNGFNNNDGDDGGDEITAELTLLSVPLLLDWHPGDHSFRFSAGLILNANKIELSAIPGDTVDLNDREYYVSRLDGEVTFNSVAPYLGIGFGDAADKSNHSWHFTFDLGVMFQGKPQIEIHATALDPSLQAAVDSDLEAETDEMEDDLAAFNMYPVLSLGIAYTF